MEAAGFLSAVQAFDKHNLLIQREYLFSIYFRIVAIPFKIRKQIGFLWDEATDVVNQIQ